MVGISIIGWKWFDGSMYVNSWNPHNVPTFEAIGVSISMTLWAFLGLESACANSDAVEIQRKRTNRGTWWYFRCSGNLYRFY